MNAAASPTPPRRARARRGEGELLRDEILDATDALLATTGDIDQVSVRMIADAVGVTPPSIYRHFEDKDALAFACCNRNFREFRDALRAAAAAHERFPDQLRATGRAYYDWGVANPEAYRLMFMSNKVEPPPDFPDEEFFGKQALYDMAAIVTAGIEAGSFRPCDPIEAVFGVWSMVHGVTALRITMHSGEWAEHMPEHDHDDVLDFVLDTIERGFVA